MGWGGETSFEMGRGGFQKVIDKLDLEGLARMKEKMIAMEENPNIDLKASKEIMKSLQAEIREREFATQAPVVNVDNSKTVQNRNQQTYAANGGSHNPTKVDPPPSSSDIRLKENIQLIEEGKDDNPNIYSFNYKKDKNTKWKGVMAQELIGTKHSDAVITDAEGFYMVDYTRLGFPMVKISE